MPRLTMVAAVLSLWLAVGCAATGPAGRTEEAAAPLSERQERPCALDRVSIGMRAAEVESVAGGPVKVERKGEGGSTQVWYYEGGVVILQADRVTFRFPPHESDS